METSYGFVDDEYDKQWASKYILGPLYDPEPSQLSATRIKALPPTPPDSASPTRPHFRARHSYNNRPKPDIDEDSEDQPFLRRLLSRSNSVNNRPSLSRSRSNSNSVTNRPLPPTPPRTREPPLSPLERKRSVHTAKPPLTRWNQGTILARANSVASSRPSLNAAEAAMAPKETSRRRAGSLAERHHGDRLHRTLETPTQERKGENASDTMPRRAGSLSLRERYPGDLSNRPLAIIAREYRAADRSPHLHNHRRQQPSDPIDALDHSGPLPEIPYHHEGPFDAATKARNASKKYSPLEAVKDTNLEALKATPAVFLKDSLDKHVPLQGTAVVPPGMQDFGGRTMEYQEGSDLNRDAHPPGGAYRPWDTISQSTSYPEADIKGKGTADFTKRKDKDTWVSNDGTVYELQPTTSKQKSDGTQVRQRSVSNAKDEPISPEQSRADPFSDSHAAEGGIHRSNTTGRSLAQSLKRRFGSIRRKKSPEDGGY